MSRGKGFCIFALPKCDDYVRVGPSYSRCAPATGLALGKPVKSTIPVPCEKCGCALNQISCHKLVQNSKLKIHALCLSFCDRKYIDNYSNTAYDIPEYLGIFVSCLSDRLVDIVSYLPLFSLGIIIVNPSLSGVWLSLLYLQWHLDQFLKPLPLLCE